MIRWLAPAACALALAAGGAAAGATGLARIQQNDGTVQWYHGVNITLAGKVLAFTSPDGKSSLIVDRAACAYREQILVCLPQSATFKRADGSHAIALAGGTVFLNFTADRQQLPFSSSFVPPHGVDLILHTARGTYFNIRGTFDQDDR